MKYVLKNKLKDNLKKGRLQIGAFVTAPCPEVVETLGLAGYDFVILDTEHTASGIETVVNMMRGAEIYGMTPIVRVCDSTPKIISRYQDVGAFGIQVPMIHTAEQAAECVRAAQFPPNGLRGMSNRISEYPRTPQNSRVQTSKIRLFVPKEPMMHITSTMGSRMFFGTRSRCEKIVMP